MTQTRWFRFKPARELWFVLLSWVLVTSTLYLSFQVITLERVAAQFITFGFLCIVLFGILVPVVWSTFVKKRPLSGLGIKKDKLVISILLCFVFAVVQYFLTLRTLALPAFQTLLPLVVMSLAVGLYENIFYRGWVQLRMEECFGIIPGVVLSAVIYCFYHVGYGMAANEFLLLFVIGLVYSTIFRFTCNIFILYPFLTPAGGLYSNMKDGLQMPFEATYGFLLVIGLSVAGLIIINLLSETMKVGAGRFPHNEKRRF